MKRVISIIFKTILIIVFNCLMFIVIGFIFDHMDSLTSGYMLRFDVRDWWYEQVNYHMLNFYVSTALLSGALYIAYKILDSIIRNIVSALISMFAGVMSLVSLNYIYWQYVWSNCFDDEWSPLEEALIAGFGSKSGAITLCGVCITVLVIACLWINHVGVFVRHERKRVVCNQVFSNIGWYCGFLYFGIPYMILFGGTYFLVGFMWVQVVPIFLVISVAIIISYSILHLVRAVQLNAYYREIENDTEKRQHLVIFEESDFIRRSNIVSLLFNKESNRWRKNSNVWLYPSELKLPSSVFIKLDLYDDFMFIRKNSTKEKIIKSMTTKSGIFNLAYNLEKSSANEEVYDAYFESLNKLTDSFAMYDSFLSFKHEVMCQLEQIDLSVLDRATCISEEIEEFKYYLIDQTTDQFIMFDMIIKWLEIANYFFALTAVSVSNKKFEMLEFEKSIDHADFNKWRDVFDRVVVSEKLNAKVNEYIVDVDVFEAFNELWKILASRTYEFKAYSIQDLLEACNYLRDYTRGHGVFTFEISQEINLLLLKLLVAILKSLIMFQGKTSMKDNLEDLGWVLYSGDTPYFLYSIDKNNGESIYESFRRGNSLSMPLETQGEVYE